MGRRFRRRWVVETRPAITGGQWKVSLGPYFRRRTAEDMLMRFRWFAPKWLVSTRIRNLDDGAHDLPAGAHSPPPDTTRSEP